MERETRDSRDTSSLTHSRTDRSQHTEATQVKVCILFTAFSLGAEPSLIDWQGSTARDLKKLLLAAA